MGGIFGVTYLDADMEGTYFGSLAQDISKNNVLTTKTCQIKAIEVATRHIADSSAPGVSKSFNECYCNHSQLATL
jgi:hypothetical protein